MESQIQKKELEDVNTMANLSKFVKNFPNCLVQTFDDVRTDEGERKPSVLTQTFEFNMARIKELQDKGAGIFLATNPTKNGKRNIANLLHISGIMLDLDVCKEKDKKDEGYIENAKEELLERLKGQVKETPHFVLETKNGLQAIWLCNPFTKYSSTEEANKMYKSLVNGLGEVIETKSEGDSVIRVFRLPFTKHQKTLSDPFLVKLLEDNSHLSPYNFDELLKKYSNEGNPKVSTPTSLPPSSVDVLKGEGKRKLDDIPLKIVIENSAKEAGITITFKEQSNGTKTIIENGEETSGFVSETGEFCYSMSGKKRKGKAVDIVRHYLKCNRSQAKKWLHKKYNISFPYSASSLAKDILSNQHMAQLSKAYFECKKNVWKEIEPEHIKDIIIKEMEGQGIHHNQTKITEILKYLDTYAYKKHGQKLGESIQSDIKKRNEIAFTNCIVNIDAWQKRSCKPEDYIITRIPFEYKERPFNCPSWLKFLDSIFAGKKEREEIISFLQEWMGYSLIHDTSLERALIFVGEGANGKSVFLHIWGGVIGAENSSHIDLGDINKEQYTAQLLGKTLNIATDVRSENQLDTGIFKKLVSGERITGKSVYQKPIEFTNYARLVFATNTLPHLKDGGTSIQRRLYILHFENVFRDDKKDVNLKFKLEEELEDILLWAIEGLKRLRKRGNFLPPKSVELAVDNYLHESDSLALFLEDHYKITKDSIHRNVERSTLYSEYTMYCSNNGYRAISNRKMYEKLRIRGVSERKSTGQRYLVGIRAIDAEVEQEEISFSPTDNGDIQM